MRARGVGREEGGGLPRGHGRRDAGRAGTDAATRDARAAFFCWRGAETNTPLPPFAHASQELDALKGADSVYKMHGKVLIRQDLAEAKSTVNSRIKLIQTEMCVGGRVSCPVCSRPPPSHTHTPFSLLRSAKVDRSIKEAQEKQQGLQRKIMELQQKRQAAGQA
jgi:hypothetical protein